ncbi:hypothetical protein ACFFX0_07100 [Citricoccus parietis]|uniref:Uncharacterized protein n=1 Tax=Citricoccus parietis TaxID=592307 RepID=A0ABV5FWB5_9MICC
MAGGAGQARRVHRRPLRAAGRQGRGPEGRCTSDRGRLSRTHQVDGVEGNHPEPADTAPASLFVPGMDRQVEVVQPHPVDGPLPEQPPVPAGDHESHAGPGQLPVQGADAQPPPPGGRFLGHHGQGAVDGRHGGEIHHQAPAPVRPADPGGPHCGEAQLQPLSVRQLKRQRRPHRTAQSIDQGDRGSLTARHLGRLGLRVLPVSLGQLGLQIGKQPIPSHLPSLDGGTGLTRLKG